MTGPYECYACGKWTRGIGDRARYGVTGMEVQS